MLQVELKTFASDAIEDAQRLAQTKAMNSFSWSDCINYLNYAWSDIYNRVVMIDEGYYSTTVQLNTQMTRLPPFVKNSIKVYGAPNPVGFNREIFRTSGMTDMNARTTYHLSGMDLYCPDATRRTVWLNFVPIAPMLFFPFNNRDPKLYDDFEPIQNDDYNLYRLIRGDRLFLQHKNIALDIMIDLSQMIDKSNEDWDVHYISCDYPYIFVTYTHKFIRAEDGSPNHFLSGFYRDILTKIEFIEYNPFDFTGRRSNVEYLQCKWNDKTGLGVIVRDWEDYDVKYYNDHKNRLVGTRQITEEDIGKVASTIGITHFIVQETMFNKVIAGNVITSDMLGEYFIISDTEIVHSDWLDLLFNGKILGEGAKKYRIKELGFTPDSALVYPCPEMYRYLVARLADKFAAFNESNVMGVAKELVEAKYAFEAFCAKDKSAWGRIDNVNGPYMTDWL